jgi:hypothetical protein
MSSFLLTILAREAQESPLKIPSLGGVARSDSGRGAPRWIGFPFPNPPEVPPYPRLIQGGTVFSSNVAPQRGIKNSFADLSLTEELFCRDLCFLGYT